MKPGLEVYQIQVDYDALWYPRQKYSDDYCTNQVLGQTVDDLRLTECD